MISNIIFFLISLVAAGAAFWGQRKFYKENKKKLDNAESLFLPKENGRWPYFLVDETETKVISCSTQNEKLSTLIAELNDYIRKNIGTTDFAIIQNKTERYAQLVYDDAISNVSFPTYIGLGGTFLGVFIGLIGFEFGDFMSFLGTDYFVLDEDNKVANLVLGVIVSMLTSLVGLILTTITNYRSTAIKKSLDERKNVFYDFIQLELMPTLGTSIVVALSKLRTTLNTFGPTFNSVVDRFKTTFDECTSHFGKEFRDNSKLLASSVTQMSRTVGSIDENIKNQKELLEEIRSNDMFSSLVKFIEAADRLEDASSTIESFASIKKDLQDSIEELVVVQQEYIKSLVLPKTIAERLNNILNRVTTFEDSVNNLGKAIDATDIITSSEMRTIEAHLDAIRRKNQIAQEYADEEDDALKGIYEGQVAAINDLNKNYRNSIEDHAEKFENMMNELSKSIQEKKREFTQILETTFSVADIRDEFTCLTELPKIKEKLDELKTISVNKENLQKSLPAIVEKLENLKTELQAVNESVNNTNSNLSSQANQVITEDKNYHSTLVSTISDITSTLSDLKTSLIETGNSLLEKSDTLISNESAFQKGAVTMAEGINGSMDKLQSKIDVINSSIEENADNIVTRKEEFSALVNSKFEDVEKNLENSKKSIDSLSDSLPNKIDIIGDQLKEISSKIDSATNSNIIVSEQMPDGINIDKGSTEVNKD